MDWNKTYEKVMRLEGLEPYGCNYPYCNHLARGPFRALIHDQLGAHHPNHRRLNSRINKISSSAPSSPKRRTLKDENGELK